MPITSRDLTAVKYGFADLWVAAADTAEPLATATLAEPSGGDWTAIGYTAEGFTMNMAIETEEIPAGEETMMIAGVAATSISVELAFALTEDTLENMALALGVGSIADVAPGAAQIGKSTLTLSETLKEHALCLMADNGDGFKNRIYIPRAIGSGEFEVSYRRAERREYATTFKAVCELDDIKIVSQTAAVTE